MSLYEEREPVLLENKGEKIFAVFHRPKINPREKKRTVMICHGFAGNKSGRFRIYVDLALKLVKEGIAVLRFDCRGSGDSEGELIDMTMEEQVADALKCLEFLTNNPAVDVNKIGILGNSLGGITAILAAKRFGKAKSLALWSPVFDVGDREMGYSKSAISLSGKEGVEIDGKIAGIPFITDLIQRKMGKEIEALASVPLMLIHGRNDQVVPCSQSERYHALRQNAKAETKFLIINDLDHGYKNPNDRKKLVEETTEWFVKTL
jgi:dipeptidyl aminopeptidase/acylaminoacyl peptidase